MSAILSGKMRIEQASLALATVLEESVETMRSFAREAKVELALKIATEASHVSVWGDNTRLHQVFNNLLHNAIKFSPPQSVVTVSLAATSSEAIISIEDQGEGISADFLPHVFERFRQADGSRTRSFGGLGLGLSLVESFVKAHHGRIEVSSDGAGKGSSFVVRLPREGAEPSSVTTRKDAGKSVNSKPLRILIVEDQPDTLEMLAASFRSHGFETIACESATDALECVGRQKFDILISDIAMPEMDGLELMRQIRARPDFAKVPAIALTGYAAQTDAKAAISAGFDLHLSKPIDPSDLMAAVNNLIALRSRRRSGQ